MASAVLYEGFESAPTVVVRARMLPTVLVSRIDELALSDAIDALEMDALEREQLIDDIELLDTLGCEALAVLHLPEEEVSAAVAMDLSHASLRTARLLGTTYRRRAFASPD